MIKRQTAPGRKGQRYLIALALASLGLWVYSLTGAIPALQQLVVTLGQTPSAVVDAFPLPLQNQVYGLLPSSALLSCGQDAVTQRQRDALIQTDSEADIPLLPSLPSPQIDTSVPPIYAQGDDDGSEVPNLPVAQAEDVVNYTATGDDSGNYIAAGGLYIADRTNKQLTALAVEQILSQEDYTLSPGAKILILHTHGTEAFTPVGTDIYLESDPYRTTDNEQNIIQVGEEIARVLRSAGYLVLHDTNLYDYPDYNSSYTNSRIAAQRWLDQYPEIALILDIHRDALTTQSGDPYRLVGSQYEAAQFMIVVGTDDSLAHPLWEENFALALQLQQQLTDDWGDLCRPTTLRSSRYNQDLSTHFLLVEVGGHGNSLQDAILGGNYFAQSLVTALSPEEVTP